MQDSRPDLQKLVHDSSLIFTGTVILLNASSVANLPPRNNFAVVRIEHSLRSDPALGSLHGQPVTVELLERGELQPDEKLVFFTQDWIQGGGIAVRELAHLDAEQESRVAEEVARQPERHLSERLEDAVLVVLAEVTAVEPAPFDPRWRNSPQWALGTLRVLKVLKGEPPKRVTVLFPTSQRPMWARAPRLSEGQRSIFLLHRPPDWVSGSEPKAKIDPEAFTVLDPADVQPESPLSSVEGHLGKRGRR